MEDAFMTDIFWYKLRNFFYCHNKFSGNIIVRLLVWSPDRVNSFLFEHQQRSKANRKLKLKLNSFVEIYSFSPNCS